MRPNEPILELADIQGNSVVPFSKPHQAFVFLSVTDPARSRRWLRGMADKVASSADVFRHNNEFRQLKAALAGAAPDLVATWQAVALSAGAIERLLGPDAKDAFVDDPFKVGLAERSGVLGDPTDPKAPGAAPNWLFGGPGKEADILVIIASDRPDALESTVRNMLRRASGVEQIWTQWGHALVGDYSGREHFGFRDGISQPGVRGRASRRRDDYITARQVDPDDPASGLWARPGQPLVWPGQFVFGYGEQDPRDPLVPRRTTARGPVWAKNGSFVVVRRLQQDVAGFWRCVHRHASGLRKQGFTDMTAVRLASLLVGRWPSGAPLSRAPDHDNDQLAIDSLANNHFGYAEPTAAIPTIDGYKDPFPPAVDDTAGLRCPAAAHIRKVNPRDIATDQGGSRDTFTHHILRRGIPFGEPLGGSPLTPGATITDSSDTDRGLMFVCYQTSIDNQFEFLQRTWSNTEDKPNLGGADFIIGQSDRPRRARDVSLSHANGASATLTFRTDFVTPSGGGYFFAPGIRALRRVIGR